MEIKWLLDFLSLVDTRNFSRSADVRATTQPAFSRRIKALEEWIGATLFDRSAHPIEMTPAGQMFRPVAEEVLRRLLQSRDEIRQMGRSTEGMIIFAATHSLSLGFFPTWISGIEKKTHLLRTRLDSNQIGICVLSLLRGECHFMLCHTHRTVPMELPADRFTSIVVGEDKLIPVSSGDANGRPIHSLPGSAGNPVNYLSYVGSSAIGRAVDSMLEHCVPRPVLRRVFDSHLAGVLKTMALEGRGLAWLPESEVTEELRAGTLLRSGDEKFFIPVQISLFRSRTTLSPAAEEFWQALVDA
jgi:LysR family transcriptional regulator, hypochlorite-specific transcription factor HypT